MTHDGEFVGGVVRSKAGLVLPESDVERPVQPEVALSDLRHGLGLSMSWGDAHDRKFVIAHEFGRVRG